MKVRLKNISHVIMGQSLQENEMFDIETEDSFEFHQGNKLFNSKNDIGKSRVFGLGGKIAIEKDILFSVRAPVGDIAILNRKIIIGRGLAAIRAGKKVNINYLYYVLNHSIEKLKESQTGTTFDSITTSELRNLIIEIYSLEQQNAIANYLDIETSKIDNKVELLSQKLEKLEEYKQSVIFETVTKGLDGSVQMKDSGIDWIGEIPKHWEVLRLKSIYNYKNGYAFSDNDYSKEPNGNYLIKITNVTESGIQEDETFCIEVNETTKKFKIKEDSILYALSGATAGKCCFLDTTEKNFYLNQRVAQMQLKNGINKYFYYLIRNKVFANLLLTLYPQTAQPNIGKNDLDNSYVPFVSNLIEQKEIVKYLDQFTSKIDKKKEIIKKQIELLNEYKKTIIYEAVTGKMEIL